MEMEEEVGAAVWHIPDLRYKEFRPEDEEREAPEPEQHEHNRGSNVARAPIAIAHPAAVHVAFLRVSNIPKLAPRAIENLNPRVPLGLHHAPNQQQQQQVAQLPPFNPKLADSQDGSAP